MAQSKRNPVTAMARDARLEPLFPVPVFRHVLTGVETLNDELTGIILDRAARSAGERKSNQGGWQSAGDFFRWPGNAVATLARYCEQALDIATARLPLPAEYGYGFQVYGWAAVNRNGDYNITHVHPMSTWSGVYYVDAGDGPGALELAHPDAAALMSFFPGLLPSEEVVQPESGLLILFPGYLRHSVRRYEGQRPRICVAFNAQLQLRAGQ